MASRLNVAVLVFLFVLMGSAVTAQREAPPGASDKGAMDRGAKDRSIELERIKRDASKPDPKTDQQKPPATATAAKFEEIKEDFEGLQRKQDEILKAYTGGNQVDLEKIASMSDQMNKHAVRLEANLFPPVENRKDKNRSEDDKSSDAGPALPRDLRSMIVEQDNTLASFVGNRMFVNPPAANADDNAKAQADLKKLILLTAALKLEAEKRPASK